MPIFYFVKRDNVVERPVPPCDGCVVEGVQWGRPEEMFTAAYWLTQYWMQEDDLPERSHRLGLTFREEVVACLLGGHGIPAEVGLAAFERLRDCGVISGSPGIAVLTEMLRRPLLLGDREIVYRFWSQKARYIAAALEALEQKGAPLDSTQALRAYLMRLPGIGPKTASWIVRNWLSSDEVAILDVHVIRAGRLMGLFTDDDRVERQYLEMERRFLDLAAAMEVSAANLDSLIWHHMRTSPRLVATIFSQAGETHKPLKRTSPTYPCKASCNWREWDAFNEAADRIAADDTERPKTKSAGCRYQRRMPKQHSRVSQKKG